MAKKTAVSNEEIIAALLQHGTIKEAAAAAGISQRCIYDRMEDREFRAEYMAAKTDIIRNAVYSINNKLTAAVDVVHEVMNNKENNAAVRLQAANIIINNASKFSVRLQHEENANRNESKSPFDIFSDI